MEDYLLCSLVTLAAPLSNPITLTRLQLGRHSRNRATDTASPPVIKTLISLEDLILFNKDHVGVNVNKTEGRHENPSNVYGHLVSKEQLPLV